MSRSKALSDSDVQALIDTFKENILSPVIYIYDDSDMAEVIAFFDTALDTDYIRQTEKKISEAVGKKVVIEDIRSYDPEERMGIIHGADISYAESGRMEEDFLNSIARDHLFAMGDRMEIVDRLDETNSLYLQ